MYTQFPKESDNKQILEIDLLLRKLLSKAKCIVFLRHSV